MNPFTHIIYRCLGIVCFSVVCSYSFCQTNLVSLAEGAVEQGDYQQAAEYLDQEIKNNPGNSDAYLLYDRLYNYVEMPATAAQICSWGIGNVTDQKERDRLIMARAEDLGALEIFESALQEFLKVSARNPKNEDAHFGVARAYLAMNDTVSALAVLYNAQKPCKESIKLQGLLVDILATQDNNKETAKQFKRFEYLLHKSDMINWTPDQVLYTQIMANLRLGNYNEMAKKLLEELIFLGNSFSEKLLIENNEAIEAVVKELDNRTAEILAMPNGNNTYNRCLEYLANIYQLAGNYKTAAKYFSDVKNEEVDILNHLHPLSKIYCYAKCENLIKSLFDKEEELVNKIPDASQRLSTQRTLKAAYAICLFLNGKYKEAITAYEEAGDEAVKSNVATAYYRLKEYDKALEVIESLIVENQSSPFLLDKAFLLSVLGRTEEANDLYQTVIAIYDEDDIKAGFALASLGDAERSRIAIKKQIESTPNDFTIYVMSAMIESVNNDFPKAVDYMKKAIKLDPKLSFEYIQGSYLFPDSFLESNEYKEVMKIIDNNRNILGKQLISNTEIP